MCELCTPTVVYMYALGKTAVTKKRRLIWRRCVIWIGKRGGGWGSIFSCKYLIWSLGVSSLNIKTQLLLIRIHLLLGRYISYSIFTFGSCFHVFDGLLFFPGCNIYCVFCQFAILASCRIFHVSPFNLVGFMLSTINPHVRYMFYSAWLPFLVSANRICRLIDNLTWTRGYLYGQSVRCENHRSMMVGFHPTMTWPSYYMYTQ